MNYRQLKKKIKMLEEENGILKEFAEQQQELIDDKNEELDQLYENMDDMW